MRDEEIEKIVVNSELETTPYFTDKLINSIETSKSEIPEVRFWSLKEIVLGFLMTAFISGGLMFWLFAGSSKQMISIPFVWALLLLLGLSYVLQLNKHRSVMKV